MNESQGEIPQIDGIEAGAAERMKVALYLLDRYMESLPDIPLVLWDLRALLRNFPEGQAQQVIEREQEPMKQYAIDDANATAGAIIKALQSIAERKSGEAQRDAYII